MKIFNLLYLLLLLLQLLHVAAASPVKLARPDVVHLRRRYHRHHCYFRRCLALHTRVPFP